MQTKQNAAIQTINKAVSHTGVDAAAGTAGTYKNLSQYNNISNFGALDLTSATFK